MSEENKTVVRQFFLRLERDHQVPDELLGPGFVYHVPGAPPIDVAALHERADAYNAAFSDAMRIEHALVAEGDLVSFRSTIEMTHTGDFMGTVGTGERISLVEMGFFRIADGKIAEMWGILDTLALLTQTGAMPKGA